MALTEPDHPKVFISYSHDSPEHADRVRELSDRLRADGLDCILDQYEVSPPEGWPGWTDKQIRDTDFVLMICTETSNRRVMGEEKPDTGLGVRWEGHLINQYIYNLGANNTKFIPVLLESGEVNHIPTILQGVAYYRAQTEEGYENLYRYLTNQPRYLKQPLGKLRKLPSRQPKQNFFATSVANLPYERNPFFTGREEILKDLHDTLCKTSATALSQAISGLGGIGKTQTAIEYAYRFRDDYKAVFWVRADSRLSLSTSFVEIARLLDLPEKDAQNSDDIVKAVNRWLENNDGWLLIFDNADELELLKDFRPHNPKGHILLTSRAHVFDRVGIAKPIKMETMMPDEALKFLFTRTGREDDDPAQREAAAQIAEALGYLPLALEQAGAYIMANTARFQDYLTSYGKRRLKLLQESRPVASEYPESVLTTWAMNFSEVEKLSEASSDLLHLSAFLSPDSIPLELITMGKTELGEAVSTVLADVDDDPLLLNQVLEPLTRYSLIRLDSDSQTYNIHRLVQEVLKDGMDTDTQRLWAEHTVRALNQAFPYVEFKDWPLCERLLPHAKAASKLIEEWDITLEEAMQLLNQAAFYSKQRGQYAEAEPLYKRSLIIKEKTLEPDHPSIATSLNNLAVLYYVQGRYSEAEPLYKRSLTIREKTFEPDHPNIATSLNNLAALYRAQSKYTEAEPLYKRSLIIHEKTFEPDHPNIATSLNNLALLYYNQGKYIEAEPLLQRALSISERALGPDHPDVAQSLNNLAGLYRIQSRYIEAEPLFKNSLTILEKAVGPDHPDVATVLENYADLLRKTQRDVEAAEMKARAEAIRAKYAREKSVE